MSYYPGFYSDIYEMTCYELAEQTARSVVPYKGEWINGKRVMKFDFYSIKGIAQYRLSGEVKQPVKAVINGKPYDVTEPCKRCQIKDKCEQGFPSLWRRLFRR